MPCSPYSDPLIPAFPLFICNAGWRAEPRKAQQKCRTCINSSPPRHPSVISFHLPTCVYIRGLLDYKNAGAIKGSRSKNVRAFIVKFEDQFSTMLVAIGVNDGLFSSFFIPCSEFLNIWYTCFSHIFTLSAG